MRHYPLYILIFVILHLAGKAQIQQMKSDTIMSEKILGLRTCIYKVSDLNEAKKWYSRAFGTKPYFDEPFYVGFNIGGYELGLLPEEGTRKEPAGNVLTYWGVEDIQKEYNSFLKLGAENHEEPHNVGGDVEVASVKDPWGNVIGIIYNPAFTVE